MYVHSLNSFLIIIVIYVSISKAVSLGMQATRHLATQINISPHPGVMCVLCADSPCV